MLLFQDTIATILPQYSQLLQTLMLLLIQLFCHATLSSQVLCPSNLWWLKNLTLQHQKPSAEVGTKLQFERKKLKKTVKTCWSKCLEDVLTGLHQCWNLMSCATTWWWSCWWGLWIAIIWWWWCWRCYELLTVSKMARNGHDMSWLSRQHHPSHKISDFLPLQEILSKHNPKSKYIQSILNAW